MNINKEPSSNADGNEQQKEPDAGSNLSEDSDDEKDGENFGNDQFKTPRKTPFPTFVLNRPILREKANETVNRFKTKAKMFTKEIDTIEEYICDGLRMRARLAIKDVEKLRNDLSDYIEEVCFILGSSAEEFENVYDTLVSTGIRRSRPERKSGNGADLT